MSKLEEYKNDDIDNPKYLYHGSSMLLEELIPMQSHDSYNKENEDKAVFLTSYLYTAIGYAFRGKLKEINRQGYNFNLPNQKEEPAMSFAVNNLPANLTGYVYVFKKEDDIIKDKEDNTTQYRCYHSLKPIYVEEVRYEDYEKYFERLSHEEFENKYRRR